MYCWREFHPHKVLAAESNSSFIFLFSFVLYFASEIIWPIFNSSFLFYFFHFLFLYFPSLSDNITLPRSQNHRHSVASGNI